MSNTTRNRRNSHQRPIGSVTTPRSSTPITRSRRTSLGQGPHSVDPQQEGVIGTLVGNAGGMVDGEDVVKSGLRPGLTKTRSRGRSITSTQPPSIPVVSAASTPTTTINLPSVSPNMLAALSPPPLLPTSQVQGMYYGDRSPSYRSVHSPAGGGLTPGSGSPGIKPGVNASTRRQRAPSMIIIPPPSLPIVIGSRENSPQDSHDNHTNILGGEKTAKGVMEMMGSSSLPSTSSSSATIMASAYPNGVALNTPTRQAPPRAGLTRRISTSNLYKDGGSKPAFGLGPRPASVAIPEPEQHPSEWGDAASYPPRSPLPRRTGSSPPSSSRFTSSMEDEIPLNVPATTSAVGGILASFWMAGRSIMRSTGVLGSREVVAEGRKRRRLSEEDEEYFSRAEGFTSTTTEMGTLPTPALSAVSLSGMVASREVKRERHRATVHPSSSTFQSVRSLLLGGGGTKDTGYQVVGDWDDNDLGLQLDRRQSVGMESALKETVKGLGWVLAMVGCCFVVSLGIVAALVMSLPITSLHSLPKQVTDLQILSAEIRSYMASGSAGWYHTIGVLVFTGMWKHSWSVPGAVVLNILVGSLLPPIPALILLTIITSFGSLGSYLLSRPLAPLIALAFPKPLALVRSAIGGDDPSDVSQGESKDTSVWRRLLIMRAMGIVPWSGMNVACGVVGVNRMTFLLTTAAGSASWSYVTASVGDILSRVALPIDADISGFDAAPTDGMPVGAASGQSLTSLLRDPALIFKLVILSALSLLPVLFKSRANPITTAPPPPPLQFATGDGDYTTSIPLLSPTTQANTPLAPTPSFYAIMSLAGNLSRKGLRNVEMVYRSTVGALVGAVREFGTDRGSVQI